MIQGLGCRVETRVPWGPVKGGSTGTICIVMGSFKLGSYGDLGSCRDAKV